MFQVRYSYYKIQNLGIFGEILKYLYYISVFQFVYKIRILFVVDIVFIVKDKFYFRFRRQGINLIYIVKVSFGKVLIGCIVEIIILDERVFYIFINDIIKQVNI